MKKTCPACGQPMTGEGKEFCPKCEALALPGNKLTGEDLQRLSQIVSERLKKDWKFKAQIIGAVLVLVLAVIGVVDAIVGFNLKESMSRHFEGQEKEAKQRMDERLKRLDDRVEQALVQGDSQMRSNISRSFQAPAIQAIIESVARGEAKVILEAEVQPAVDNFRRDALFIRTVALAQAYDFKAYQRLLEIGRSTNENATIASQVVAEIDRALEKDRLPSTPKRVFVQHSGTNLYGGPFASDELATRFSSIAQNKTISNREGFVNTVGELKQPLFLPSMIEFFTNETDLAVADRLTLTISDLAKEDFRPHDFERIVNWWNDHHAAYTNWPLAALERGRREFSSVHYAQAAEAFEQVLEADSGADMSRAHVIACYWEMGQTNRAVMLARGFKNPSARWAQWAAAKAELESGSRSNATIRFFSITTNFPTMDPLPDQRSDVFKKINWQLFNKLRAAGKP